MIDKKIIASFINNYHNMFLGEASDEDLEQILSFAQVQYIDKNNFVYQEGDPAEYCYLLLKGKIEIYKNTELNNKRLFGVIETGCVFGVPELFHKTHQVNCYCLANSITGCIPRDVFFNKVFVYQKFIKDCMKWMADNFTVFQSNYVIEKIETKFLIYLHVLVLYKGIDRTSSIYIPIRQTHERISELLNITRETVTRLITKYKKEGLIDIENRCFVIKNIEGLKKRIPHHWGLVGIYEGLFTEEIDHLYLQKNLKKYYYQ